MQRRDLHCHVCGVTDTPEWRRGPDGDHTYRAPYIVCAEVLRAHAHDTYILSSIQSRLCNACGLHYAKALKKEKEAREKEGRKHSIDMLLNNQVCVCVYTRACPPLLVGAC